MKLFIAFLFFTGWISCQSQTRKHNLDALHIKDIPLPAGYERFVCSSGSFESFLQNLTMDQNKEKVMLYDGTEKHNQNAHFRIIKLDVGNQDLQQCADAIIRLRAEYLWEKQKYNEIHFNFTNGDTAHYIKFRSGYRPVFNGNNMQWEKHAQPDSTYEGFRAYLNLVFTYAGTSSLNKELINVQPKDNIKIGDIFIQTGKPYGHAIIIVDMAIHKQTKEKIFLLAQSYMPAQDIHILKNPDINGLNPWYRFDTTKMLITPEWNFNYTNLKRFK